MSRDDTPTTVTLYHSAICPRCRLAAHFLARMLPEFPQVQLEKVEYLTHLAEARAAGVTVIPALRAGSQKLSGFLLTPRRIRRFLESLPAD